MQHPDTPVPGTASEQLFSQSQIAEQVTDYIFSLPHWEEIPIAELQAKARTIAQFLESARTVPDDLQTVVDRVVPKWQAVEILRKSWSALYQEMEDEPTADELRAWNLLLHARQYLEAQR